MEQQKTTVFEFITQVFVIFSINVLFLLLVGSLVGEEAKSFSSMFSLGSKGLSTETLLQFFLSSVLIISIKYLFYSKLIFKTFTTLWRTILMVCSVFLIIISFILIFNWFSVNNLYAWISFIITFIFFVSGSMFLLVLKAKMRNKEYEKRLTIYKQQHKGETIHE